MSGAAVSKNISKKVVVRVYRSLLRASRPFTHPAPHASVLSSLLHRKVVLPDYYDDALSYYGLSAAETEHNVHNNNDDKGTTTGSSSSASQVVSTRTADDDDDDEVKEQSKAFYREAQQAELYVDSDDSKRMDPPHYILFSYLLQELMGDGVTLMRFPSQLSESDLTRLRSLIQREFRSRNSPHQTLSSSSSSSSISRRFPYRSRIQASFLALRELNKKLYYALSQGLNVNSNDGSIQGRTPTPVKGVSPLPCYPPSSYLKPGTFLLAHPLIDGFFSQTVIVILDHTDDLPSSTPSSSSAMAGRGGTYGLIINKPATIRKRLNTSAAAAARVETATVSDIFRNKLSVDFHDAFYDSTVRIGGPVHSSVQMIYKCSQDQELSLQLGGRILPEHFPSVGQDSNDDSSPSPEPTSDDVIYFQGDFHRVAKAVLEGKLSKDSVSFVVGATAWSPGQLQSEIERGWWIPCSAPLQMTLTGKYALHSHDDYDDQSSPIIESQYLWQSMMAGIGDEEAKLAYLFRENNLDENIDACDEFL